MVRDVRGQGANHTNVVRAGGQIGHEIGELHAGPAVLRENARRSHDFCDLLEIIVQRALHRFRDWLAVPLL